VILAVPISIIQDEEITFEPSLPDWKIAAAKAVKFQPSSKVVGFFTKQFWPNDMRSVICSQSSFPEMWPINPERHVGDEDDFNYSDNDSGVDTDEDEDDTGRVNFSFYDSDDEEETPKASIIAKGPCSVTGSGIGGSVLGKQIGDSSTPSDGVGRTVTSDTSGTVEGPHIFVGFCCANYARKLNSLNMKQLRDIFCQQLDTMFGTVEDPKPASSSCRDVLICRWGRKRFIRGGYSSPARKPDGLSEHHLVLLRRSLAGRLFFAGEAVMDGHSTMDAAADAGVAACREILQCISGNTSGMTAKL